MSVNSISTSSESASVLQQLSATTSSSSSEDIDLTEIENEIKSSSKQYTAQQIMQEYDVTRSQAEEILKELEQTQSSQQSDISFEQVQEEVSPGNDASTIQYRA